MHIIISKKIKNMKLKEIYPRMYFNYVDDPKHIYYVDSIDRFNDKIFLSIFDYMSVSWFSISISSRLSCDIEIILLSKQDVYDKIVQYYRTIIRKNKELWHSKINNARESDMTKPEWFVREKSSRKHYMSCFRKFVSTFER